MLVVISPDSMSRCTSIYDAIASYDGPSLERNAKVSLIKADKKNLFTHSTKLNNKANFAQLK
jgi:hypothetical protein